MITIEVGNSYSQIKGLSATQHKALAAALSYIVGDHFSTYGPSKRSLLSRKGEFPTGLLPRIIEAIKSESVFYDDKRKQPPLSPSVPALDFQRPPLYKSQKEAYHAAMKYGKGIISMPTGTGKSRVIELLAQGLGVKTLVIVPSLEIKKQLQEQLKGHKNVTIENIDSKRLQRLQGYDCLIIDEAHHVAAKTYQKLNKTAWKDIYYRFFLTATPFRNKKDEMLLFEAIAGPVIYQLSYKMAIREKYIVPVEAYYYQLPKVQTDAYTWAQVYSELVVNNKVRNETICITLLRLNKAGVSTLCLVKEVKHGQILSEMSGLPFVSGQDEDSRDYIRQFNLGQIKTLIATTGVMGEGVDSKPCEYVIIAGLGKAKSQFMQQIGRSVRTYPGKESAKVILFKDMSHRFLSRHYRAQCVILKEEYGIEPLKVDL